MINAVRPPLTPPVKKAETMEPTSRPETAAALPMPNIEVRIWPPMPPPRAPAMELPKGPKLRSFETLPAALPPSAPAMSCMMSAVRFIRRVQWSSVLIASHYEGHELHKRYDVPRLVREDGLPARPKKAAQQDVLAQPVMGQSARLQMECVASFEMTVVWCFSV